MRAVIIYAPSCSFFRSKALASSPRFMPVCPRHQHMWRRFGAAQINQFFMPGVLLSRQLGREDCLGATMALHRDTLAQVADLRRCPACRRRRRAGPQGAGYGLACCPCPLLNGKDRRGSRLGRAFSIMYCVGAGRLKASNFRLRPLFDTAFPLGEMLCVVTSGWHGVQFYSFCDLADPSTGRPYD